jgi:hypothetical protein
MYFSLHDMSDFDFPYKILSSDFSSISKDWNQKKKKKTLEG